MHNATHNNYSALMASPKDLTYLDCSIANSMEVIGDRWNILILRDAFMGVRRFEDFHKDLGIARNILSDRLDRLVAADVLKQVRYQDNPPRDEYKLTPKGQGSNGRPPCFLALGRHLEPSGRRTPARPPRLW